MIVLANILFVLLISCNVINATIGINWGRQTPTQMVPSMVVDVLLQNNIKEAKIYNADEGVIRAFRGADIGLTINAYEIQSVSTLELARSWVQRKVLSFPDVNIKYILIGRSNSLAAARAANSSFLEIMNAVSFVQQALNEAGYGEKTKAIISNSLTGVLKYKEITKPSDGEFQDDIKDVMAALLKVFTINDSPFVYDIFPIAYVYGSHVDFNFAFFDNKSTHIVKDRNAVYTNLFEFVHDSFAWALKKIGAPDNMKIVVGQIGWPTDGFPGATASVAEHYYKGLLPFVMSNKGTPMRPGAPIDVYIHSLTDEKLNPDYVSFTRHWGIYRSNGEPKYKIDFSGQGRDIFPAPAKGIGLMPWRWCVFNEDFSDPTKVQRQYDEVCRVADCTSMTNNGSCSMLSRTDNISYAFNVFFQSHFQAEDACSFEGLGKIVVENPSKNGCVFSVEVVKGTMLNGGQRRGFDGVPKFVLVLFLVVVLLVSFF